MCLLVYSLLPIEAVQPQTQPTEPEVDGRNTKETSIVVKSKPPRAQLECGGSKQTAISRVGTRFDYKS